MVASESHLASLCLALDARSVRGWSAQEDALTDYLPRVDDASVAATLAAIRQGQDPLGDAFCALRTPEQRRPSGATYTPSQIVESMLAWAVRTTTPERVIDPGTGSARFLVAAGRRFPAAHLLGVEIDPLAALVARAHLAAAGLASRAEILTTDFRAAALKQVKGTTLYLGNPPYVRHHLLGDKWKQWLAERARARGLQASQLAGLHVHFFLATADHARRGDVGAFITAAEWLDVNYGKVVRDLLLNGLGARGIHVIEPDAMPFADAASTAVITCFEVGVRPKAVTVRRVASLDTLGDLTGGRPVRRERLETAARWTPLTRAARKGPDGYVELGELCRVHRGQVTGANSVWIAGAHSADLPESVLFPSVTKARELIAAGASLTDANALRCVIDIPPDLDTLTTPDRDRVQRFIKVARKLGADRGFVAQHRRAWWSVGLRRPAPILATYMARRPPAFVLNKAEARHINIAHGLYPREPLAATVLSRLVGYLSHSISVHEGRTYAGGLTKFEPKEMERLMVPSPSMLLASEGEALA